MGSPDVIRFPSSRALVEHAATALLAELAASVRTQPFRLALSGGRVAGEFFTVLAAQARHRDGIFDHVEFYWADERCVPPTDDESNFALAERTLLTPLAIRPEQIRRIRGELLPDVAAADAEAELARSVGSNLERQPVLDLIHLGMGEDGHIASLFPGEPEELLKSTRIYRAVTGHKPPTRRVTMNYAALAAARQVWVIASGAGKREALHRSLTDPSSTPLGRLMALRTRTVLLTDLPPGI